MKRYGFTLIEILVTVAIIGVLVAMLVPAVENLRARSQSSTCLSNLRALGVAFNRYLGEHNMQIPDLAAGRNSKNEEVAVIDNTFDTYVDDQRVFACPSDQRLARETGTSYFWNSALKEMSLTTVKFFEWNKLSEVIVMLDKEGWHRPVARKVNYLFADGHVSGELPPMDPVE